MYKLSKYNVINEYDDRILIYNSYTKGSIVLEKGSDISAFKNIDDFYKLDDDTKNVLIENEFVIDDSRDEFEELKYSFNNHYFDSKFFNISLVASMACNFKCPYCFEKDLKVDHENIKKYFSVLKKFAKKNFRNHKVVQISLFGGEPLLFADEYLSFLKFVDKDSKEKDYQYIVTITTNGSLLNEKLIKELFKYNLRSVQITLDGDKDSHNTTRIFHDGRESFDLLIDNINTLMSIGSTHKDFEFVLRFNLNNTTVDKVRKSIKNIDKKYRKKIDVLVRAVYNTHCYDKKNSNNVGELEEYYNMFIKEGFKILKRKFFYQSCEACNDTKFFYLMPDLTLWKCINDLRVKNACVGIIDDTGEMDLYPENLVTWHRLASSFFDDIECKKCNLLPDCLGGCIMYKNKNQERKQCRKFDMISMPFSID